jgi:hypothetical protein
MAKLDIKDFYLQGDHEVISSMAFKDEYRKAKSDLSLILHHALSNPYVFHDLLPQRLFRVRQGSGMGQRASGELADNMFHCLVEEWAVNDDTKEKYEIIYISAVP